MALLDVVGQQLLEVAVKDSDAGDDVAGSRCPGERFRAAVPVLDVRLDRLDEYAEGGERAAPDRLPRDDVQPDFYLVQPGTAGRGTMKGDAWMLGKPVVHVIPFVCDRLSRTTWISRPGYRATTASRNVRNSLVRRRE